MLCFITVHFKEKHSILKYKNRKCKLCDESLTKKHLRTDNHQLAKTYFYDNSVRIFEIEQKHKGCFFSIRVTSHWVSSILGYFRSIEQNVSELTASILQLKNFESVKVSLRLFVRYDNRFLENDPLKYGIVNVFVMEDKVIIIIRIKKLT